MKATIEIRVKAVVFYEEGIRNAKEIGETYNLSETHGEVMSQGQ